MDLRSIALPPALQSFKVCFSFMKKPALSLIRTPERALEVRTLGCSL